MAPSKEPCTFGGAIIDAFFLCITFFMDHPCRKVLTLRILDVLRAQHVSPPFASLLFVPHPTLPLKAAWTHHAASLDMPGQASSPVPPALDEHPAQKARAVFPCPAFVFHPHASHVLLFFGRCFFLAGSSGSVLALFDGTKGFGLFGSLASSNHT